MMDVHWREKSAILESRKDRREVAELAAAERAGSENITFGIDSSAAITVMVVATDDPTRSGPVRRVRDCQDREVKHL